MSARRNSFTFHADIAFDHVLPSGQRLQYSASEDVALQRPGGSVEWSGDLDNRQFWYDGTAVTCMTCRHPPVAAPLIASRRWCAVSLGGRPMPRCIPVDHARLMALSYASSLVRASEVNHASLPCANRPGNVHARVAS